MITSLRVAVLSVCLYAHIAVLSFPALPRGVRSGRRSLIQTLPGELFIVIFYFASNHVYERLFIGFINVSSISLLLRVYFICVKQKAPINHNLSSLSASVFLVR